MEGKAGSGGEPVLSQACHTPSEPQQAKQTAQYYGLTRQLAVSRLSGPQVPRESGVLLL